MSTTVVVGATDQSSKLLQPSLSLKFNTFDFVLIDPAVVPALNDLVTVTNPTWTGNVSSVRTSDPVNKIGHVYVTISATNSDTGTASAAPFNLSDSPNNTTTFGYQNLSVQTSVDSNGVVKTQGQCEIVESGLWPAMTFTLTSTNQGYSAQSFSVTDVTVTWPAKSTNPVYTVRFGDPIVTMSVWANSAASGIFPIDTTKITDGAVTTPKLAAGAVTADTIAASAITADKLAATLVLASLIKAGSGVAHTEMDANGFRAYDASGNLVVNIPDDGSPVTVDANIIAQTLSVTGNATLQGTDNELALGSVLQLDSAQGDPTLAPSLAKSWDGVSLPVNSTYDLTSSTYSRVGLDYDSAGGAGGATKVFYQATNKGDGSTEYILELLASDRSVNRAINFGAGGSNGNNPLAVCRLGSYVYVLSADKSVGTGGSGSTGYTAAATFSFNFSGSGTDDQIFEGPFTLPSDGVSYTISSVVVNCGSHSGSTTGYGVIWDASGNVIGQSSGVSMAAGHTDRTFTLASPITLSPGTQFYVGFARTSSGSGEWGVTNGGSFHMKQQASVPGSVAGYSNCAPAYVCGNMKAYANWTKNTATTTYVVRRYLQSTLALDTTYSSVTFPITPVSPVMCSDGTNLYIVDRSTTIKWQKYDGSLVTVGSVIDTTYDPGQAITAAAAGNFDFGAARVAVASSAVDTFNSTGTRQTNEQFPYSSTAANGIAYGDALADGARFWTLPPTSTAVNLTKHSTWTWTTASSIYWVAYSWYDSNATGGTHESTVGPRASITMGRRQQLVITSQSIPGAGGTNDPNNIRFYTLPNATDPGVGGLKLQATQSATTLTLTSYASGGAADPSSNNFPAGTAGTLKSQTGGLALNGDGTGNLGDKLTWTKYRARGHASAQFAIANASVVYIPTGTIDYDPNGNLATTGIYTCPVSGYYWCRCQSVLDSSYSNTYAALYKNNSTEIARGPQGTLISVDAATIVFCSAGDTIRGSVTQNSGGAHNSQPGSTYSWNCLEVQFVGT